MIRAHLRAVLAVFAAVSFLFFSLPKARPAPARNPCLSQDKVTFLRR